MRGADRRGERCGHALNDATQWLAIRPGGSVLAFAGAVTYDVRASGGGDDDDDDDHGNGGPAR